MNGFSGPVPDEMWTALRQEFGLPSLEDVRARLSVLPEPETVQRALVRVFIGDGTFCPGFQFLPSGQLDPRVTALFETALEAKVPHNYFALWMMTPVRELSGMRPWTGWMKPAGSSGFPLSGPPDTMNVKDS